MENEDMKTLETRYTVYRKIRVINNITHGTYFGYVPEEEISRKHAIGGYWLQTCHLPLEKIREIVFSEDFLNNVPNLKRSVEKFGVDNFTIESHETDTYGEIDAVESANDLLISRFMTHFTYPCYNNEFMLEEDEIDWKKLQAKAIVYKAEIKKKNAKSAHRPSESITIKNIETGEKKTFNNKTECMQYLNTSSATFSKFIKGTSKLNKLYEIC